MEPSGVRSMLTRNQFVFLEIWAKNFPDQNLKFVLVDQFLNELLKGEIGWTGIEMKYVWNVLKMKAPIF